MNILADISPPRGGAAALSAVSPMRGRKIIRRGRCVHRRISAAGAADITARLRKNLHHIFL
jgi:hypothetical protein